MAALARAASCAVVDGAVYAEISGAPKAYELSEAIASMVGLARRVPKPEALPESIRDTAINDVTPAVRRRALELLIEHYPHRPATRDALVRALRDPEAAVAYFAARRLQAEGFEVMQRLTSEEAAPVELREQAIDHLARNARHWREIGLARVGDALLAALESSISVVRRKAVWALGWIRHAEALGPIMQLAGSAEPALRVSCAAALGRLGEGEAEPMLIGLLDDEDLHVRRAAARSLAQIGSLDCFEQLLEMASSGLGALEEDALFALRSIRARLEAPAEEPVCIPVSALGWSAAALGA